MHVYYKFGLLLIFLLSVSISHTNAAPAQNQSNVEYDYYGDDDDYSDEQLSSDGKSPETAENRLMPTSSTTTTTTFRPIFNIPRRSNHVLEPSCPRACHCLEDYKYVQCANAHLTHVPLDMPKTAAIIDLSHNVIAELRAEDFANLSKVVEINLNYNLLSRVDKEAFNGLERLQRLRLTNNRLTKIEPDTFAGAADLSQLDLSNNSISQRTDGSFLNQPSLTEFSCSNCSWTHLTDQTFVNMSSLNVLRLDHNDFKKQINTRAFTPLKNLIKLKLPELDQQNIEDLCNLLKSIDNISFKHFDVSCFELVLGTSFNESLIFATDPPFKRVTDLPTTVKTTPAPQRTANRNKHNNKMSNDTTSITPVKAGILSESSDGVATSSGPTDTGKENPNQVSISEDTINTLLICIMVIAIIGIIIGLICRKDVFGIKTKCCRTSKPEPKDQVHPTEEIPLNKLA
ncbi:leucine-rich repeat-containing G-protein coupled receptor 6 [Scaptodrosophila lebanonensis]|uniref:Leucine-rich repeat-containing G-protein coupled receptor 6 n=1 Tax=Drosophila lebanonensis TaxID=7225 RepID=A0A6J2T587_DROLE|nr:leucine-rich repeat-containing G-protein coupled receptor 6 [Scaptodrosophila lebanonensis]XP_030372092.1 leucine-rich repeat-containing G-protein coupled receptor 6 [Scaptodrosophila lebanonensis]XP_030372093.1 leucine-rich repeat-containing G-protein coupled receptor 6 [Scaptodrosophila lebanonensis]